MVLPLTTEALQLINSGDIDAGVAKLNEAARAGCEEAIFQIAGLLEHQHQLAIATQLFTQVTKYMYNFSFQKQALFMCTRTLFIVFSIGF
jgi:hypothetical protein